MLSGLLSGATFIFVSALRLISTIILTRILAPDIFGTFAVLLSILFVLTMFSDLGIRSLILTREESGLDVDFLRSCWTLQILRGGLLGIIILIIAGIIILLQNTGILLETSGYADPVLPATIGLSALSFLILGFEIPNKYIYEREMNFGILSVKEVILAIFSLVVVVSLALYLKNIWALVFASIISAAIQVFLSLVMFRGPAMQLTWHKEHIRVIFLRARWIISHSALTAITNVADRLIIGVFVSASDFGYYHIARQLIDMPTLLLNKIHSQVGLQLFSEIHKHETLDHFRADYYKYRQFFDTASMIGCGMLFVLAPLLIEIVYDARYEPVAHILQVLALGLPLSGFVVLREAFSAQRRFKKMTVLSIVQAASVWVGLLLALPVLHSTQAAFWVVSLHRTPEILLLLIMGRQEKWVLWKKEFRYVPLIFAGMGIGWLMDVVARNLLSIF
ncbi:oligosaccharide flippase family protein [Ruegeria sp. ANG-S4]|uniref:oligosaccharide flippase family protein n=1 Tax=Ruegeria sp. ANG-S4 TaxID=1577904 RepID=UPI00057E823D|nr:oligosaccharide flippase family protein [Ruegeria sp. ANG-S4]